MRQPESSSHSQPPPAPRDPRALGPDLDISSLARGLPLGDRVGPYTLRRWIGSGGMGAVFEALGPVSRIALKLVPPANATPDASARLAAEAAALARMDHPGIVRVIDSGIHRGQSGAVPFLAMELVESAADIAAFCEQFGLALADRIVLMIAVCDAAQHAHDRGVIHRDIKPANILVDHVGKPRLIDFGVCRVVGADTPPCSPARVSPRTRVGQFVGTLAYMAPEQTDADPFRVDPRCDVYALGAVLYQLLTGVPPYDFGSTPSLAAAARLRRRPPVRPSRLDARLRGGLESIVLHAMAPNPARRYQTAAALADDLRRFRCGQPISTGEDRATAWMSLVQSVRELLRRRGAIAE